MNKQIPIYFDSVIVSSPLERISETNNNLGRLQVRVFTKYKNRNGSYITDSVAEQLINSAIQGDTPVVGFFDPESQSWASHTGPSLANGYGYIEDFVGWQPFQDTDGVTRDYAVFSVVLFTKYFEEAQKVLGQNQSMELDIDSITGDWTFMDDQEYFVYKTARILGCCIIGDHEPCFSVSAFFSKNDDTYNTQYDKFSSLLFDLKTQVEEAEKNLKGGEQPMNEFENQEAVTEEVSVEETEVQVEETAAVEFEESTAETEVENETSEATEEEVVTEESAPSEYDLLQEQFNTLQTSYNELEQNYANAQTRISEYEAAAIAANEELESLRAQNAQLQSTLQTYEAQNHEIENNKKFELIEKYKNLLAEEEIDSIKETVNDFSYDELESKLAITFANKKIAGADSEKKVPLPEPEESQFALLMKKYRKN